MAAVTTVDCSRAQRQAACLRAEAIGIANDIVTDVVNAAAALLPSVSVEQNDVEIVAKQLVMDVVHKATELVRGDQHKELVSQLAALPDFERVAALPSDSVSVVLYCMVWYGMVCYGMGMVWYSVVWYVMIW